MCLQIQDEQAQRVEAELDRLILEQHITEQSLAGVTMLPGEPAKKSKKKCRYKSQYVNVTDDINRAVRRPCSAYYYYCFMCFFYIACYLSNAWMHFCIMLLCHYMAFYMLLCC